MLGLLNCMEVRLRVLTTMWKLSQFIHRKLGSIMIFETNDDDDRSSDIRCQQKPIVVST